MAGKSLFGRDDEDDKSSDDARPDTEDKKQPEGVRLLEPDKAAELEEKTTTAKRRGGDIPKYGDRPEPPATDKKAAIRLPLSGSTDLSSIERPKPAPVTRPRADGSMGSSPTQVSIGAPTVGTGEVAAVSVPPTTGAELPPPDAEPSRRKRRKQRKEDKVAQDELVQLDPQELERVEPKRARGDADDADAPALTPAEPAPPTPTTTGSTPVIAVDPPTGEVAMPHWTEPATGEVPKIIIGDTPDDEDDQAAWDSFAGGAGPRYRGQHDSWDDTSVTDLLDDDPSGRIGALAPVDDDQQTQDEFLTLEDIDMPDLTMPKPPTRGSVQDPVRQGKAGINTTGSTPVVRPTKKAASRPARAPEERTRPASERERRPTGDNKTVSERLGLAAPQPSGGGRDLKTAIIIGVPMGLAAWALFAWAPKWIGMIVITALIFLSGAEFLAAVGTRRFKPVLPVAWAALLAMPIAAFASGEVAIPLILFLTLFCSFLWYILGLATEKPLGNLGVTFFAVLWVGMFGSFAALLYRIGPVLVDGVYEDPGGKGQGPSILILAILVSVVSDAGALGWGKLYGKRTFTPISPNKTIEGLIGGVLTAVVVTTIAGMVFGPFTLAGTAFFALCCAIASPIGDLAESLIKRDIGLKDMSDLIPGHGGVLDRFDALLFVLPVAYFVTRLLLPGIPWF